MRDVIKLHPYKITTHQLLTENVPILRFIIVDRLSRDSAIPRAIPSSQIMAPNVGPIVVVSEIN